MQMDEAKKNKKFPKGCGAFMEDRSSRTNKYSGLKGPNLGTRQKQMGGEGLLYTCPAVYIPFLKIYSVILFSAAEKTCGHRDSPLPAAANVTVPGKPQNVSANHGKSNLQFKAIQEALSELSRSCWCSELLNKPITSPLLPKCVLLRGRDMSSLSFQLLRDIHPNTFEVTGTGKPNFILDWFFSVDGNAHLIVFYCLTFLFRLVNLHDDEIALLIFTQSKCWRVEHECWFFAMFCCCGHPRNKTR